MERQSTQVEYGQRIKRVLTYVEEHLNEDLSLNKLAQLACLASYHFHRIYRSMLGETVAETPAAASGWCRPSLNRHPDHRGCQAGWVQHGRGLLPRLCR